MRYEEIEIFKRFCELYQIDQDSFESVNIYKNAKRKMEV